MTDLGVGNASVNLCGLDACVPQHLTDRLDWHSVGERDSGSKRVSRKVIAEVFLYLAECRYLLQVVVNLLIRRYRE